MTREAAPLTAGETLVPGYEVLDHLARSGGYDVYDVWSAQRACRCVAKTPRPDRAEDADVRRRLVREGRLLRKFTHPHLVRAYDVIREERAAVVLETLTGQTLAHLVKTRARRLPLSEVAHLGLHLCSAVHYLHGQNLLHLDLKPSNIVSEKGFAKVLDLSIARAPGGRGQGAGTPQYMAPEQASGGVLTAAADVWGIGAVLYEAATGEAPFDAPEDTAEDHYEQLERRAHPVRALRRVSQTFGAVLDGCLEPDPPRRPSVEDLARMLEDFA